MSTINKLDSMPTDKNSNLLPCLARLAQLQQESVDRLEVHAAIESALEKYVNNPQGQLKSIATQLQVAQAQWLQVADAARIPALLFTNSPKVLYPLNFILR